eukprot:TRINITY_DN1569_c0_g1_i1.p1 TRINITY_DN1569_c0_g1~~TRINITY_DN1569_c0_g1_i1.p1  ORF type:complete len:605 (+),score=140.07 TRINITY_DN1569_c0_g1_i1:89-1903(+)
MAPQSEKRSPKAETLSEMPKDSEVPFFAVKNTFIELQGPPEPGSLSRYATCPSDFQPLLGRSRSCSTEHEGANVNEEEVVGAAWSEVSTEDENSDQERHLRLEVEDGSELEDHVPSSPRLGGGVCWADLSSDGEEVLELQRERPEILSPCEPKDSKIGSCRWSDLASEDEEDPSVPQPFQGQRTEAPVSERRERPIFQRATREAKERHLMSNVREFCSLSFDEVDAAQQMGLTHRMLVLVKSLADPVTYWTGAEQQKEDAYKLLGLEESDMYAIGRSIKKASKLIDSQKYHEAFYKLSKLRPWFQVQRADEESLEDQRARLRAAAEEDAAAKCQRKDRNLDAPAQDGEDGDDDGDSWTTVPVKKLKEQHTHKAKARDGQEVPGKATNSWAAMMKRPTPAKSITTSLTTPVSKLALKPQPPSSTQTRQSSAVVRPTTTAIPPPAPTSHPHRQQYQQHQSYYGRSTAEPKPRIPASAQQGASTKHLCRYRVGIEEERAFQVCRKIIGPGGENMKHIASAAGGFSAVKLRLRGKGSKYLEGPTKEESSDPLMLCISAENPKAFETATSLVEELLKDVHEEYRVFCAQRRRPCSELSVVRESQRSDCF